MKHFMRWTCVVGLCTSLQDKDVLQARPLGTLNPQLRPNVPTHVIVILHLMLVAETIWLGHSHATSRRFTSQLGNAAPFLDSEGIHAE